MGHAGHPDRDAGGPGVSMRRVWLVAQQDLLHNLRRPFFWFLLVIICFLTWGLSSGNARIASATRASAERKHG